MMIDPETRDVVQNVYIRRVQKVGNELVNVVFDTYREREGPGGRAQEKVERRTRMVDPAVAGRAFRKVAPARGATGAV